MERMEGRVAIITGATRGMGEAIVRIRVVRLDAKLPQATSMSRITCMISQIQKMVNSYG